MINEVSVQNETGKVKLAARLTAWGEPWLTTRNLCILIFLFTVLVMVGYKPLKQPVGGDTAVYDYIAQAILRGQMPYRDIADIKLPGSVYLNAAAMAIGNLFGLKDIFALRFMQIIEFGIYNIFLFLVAGHYLRSRLAGLIAVMFQLMMAPWAKWILSGTQPKLPMMMFGVLTLWLLAKDKPFWAGVCGMMSCLCWQPGLLFVGAAGLSCSNYLRSWRDLRVIKVIAGAALPLVVLCGYFLMRGALDDLWAWTMEYNYSVFGPDAQRDLEGGWWHLHRVMRRIFRGDAVLVYLSVAGFLVYVCERVRARWQGLEKSYTDGQYRDALIFPVIVYFLFTLVNMQAGPDLIPYLPFMGLFAGYFFVLAGRLLASLWKKPEVDWARWTAGAALLVLTMMTVTRAATYKMDTYRLNDQYIIWQPYRDMLGEGDKLYVHGTVEMLVLYNLENLNPYIFLDWGADEFAAHKRGTTFEQIIEEMEAQKPKLVFLTRLKRVRKADAFQRWVDAHYTGVPGGGVFIRKE